jgi:glutamate formiminotransferase
MKEYPMKPLLEFVPNFSEGKDQAIIDSLVKTMTSVTGVTCLGAELDGSHNRAVVTLAGESEAVAEAAFVGARAAIEKIDLRDHVGEHKRMGAMDVCPFVPLGESTMHDAVVTARAVGQRIGDELGMPVFLYAEACMREDRRKLGNVRNKQFEGLLDLVGADSDYAPDFGPNKMHATAGAIGVGARTFLIAYNINLQTSDVQVAKDIAKAVREKDGGFKKVQGMGFYLDDKSQAQVSMNLLDYTVTSIRAVYDRVAELAKAQGVEIAESELIGLAPSAAMNADLANHIKLPNFDADAQIVEAKLRG